MISVIMSVFNEKIDWIKQSVQSILNQTYANLEFIIVIDNPNVDKSVLLYLNGLPHIDSRVKILMNEKNVGLAISLNRALAVATGELIARMDADDISEIDRLEKEIKYLMNHKLDIWSCVKI
ncbi:glycosyltransferase family 2 protein [Pseudobutyrivibrio xylanivorans]|uniref:Glycosyl transferase family 2 n=1 Tax=Pseudobutyrivibrio xylanivorans TaxID=185007 RepID=A0A5P6VVB9_PSEXY|nr:glycosyltransferase family 2 protein [Pseudobutyrivibrio xylanivorans]QFJ55859.1 glycosyl transferase family 2 [Pseudobutyrivibrio xylanivorans]